MSTPCCVGLCVALGGQGEPGTGSRVEGMAWDRGPGQGKGLKGLLCAQGRMGRVSLSLLRPFQPSLLITGPLPLAPDQRFIGPVPALLGHESFSVVPMLLVRAETVVICGVPGHS